MDQQLVAYRLSTAEPVEFGDTVWTAVDGEVHTRVYLGPWSPDRLGAPDPRDRWGTVEILDTDDIVLVTAADWGLYVKAWTAKA